MAHVRLIREADVPSVLRALHGLLAELRNRQDTELPQGCEALLREYCSGRASGVVLVAEDERDEGEIVGFISLSIQAALRTGGEYAIIQELWVAPGHRSKAVGSQLLAAACAHCSGRGITRIEVGLPGEGFPEHERTRAFYARNGYIEVGLRMRRDG